MKNVLTGITLLILPLCLIVLVNESCRNNYQNEGYTIHGITAMNSSKANPGQCTWRCHNDTEYCKEHHVKYLKSGFDITDKLYYGAINVLKAGGNYVLANIILLVIIIPLLTWYLLLRSLIMLGKINRLKHPK